MESMKAISENLHVIMGDTESISWLELAQVFGQRWGVLTGGSPLSTPLDNEGIIDVKQQADAIYNKANHLD